MRIVFVISVVGKVKRGGESTTMGLVSFLSRHAHVTVISGGPFEHDNVRDLSFPDMPRYASLYEGLPSFIKHRLIRRLHLDPLSVRNFSFCRRALRYIVRENPDVVVFRSVGPWGAKTGRYLRSRHGIPFITIEGGWKTGERETARYGPNLHISVNPDVADYLKDQLPGMKIAYIPNGISVKDFAPYGRKAGVALPRPLFLGCGAMEEVKRFHLSIKAVHYLGRGSLLLLGKGSREASLRQLGKRLLEQRFLLDAAPYEDMPSYYRAADVVTLPSSGESFGMVYLEAMACNTPVVATLDRNRKNIVGQGGKLVNPLDIGAYAAALEDCLKTDFDNQPRKQAEKFDWSKVGPQYLNAFKGVVEDSKISFRRYPLYRRMGHRATGTRR